MAKAGRRPGQTETREQIMASARGLFAERGFDATTIRAIAADAGVNPALIHHFFGSKNQVFVAAMALPVNPAEAIGQAIKGSRGEIGERLVRSFLSVWGDGEARQPLLALLRSIASHENAARMMREFVLRTVVRPIAAELGIGELAMTATASHLVGIAMLRYVVRVEPLASASDDDVVATVAPVIQRYFD